MSHRLKSSPPSARGHSQLSDFLRSGCVVFHLVIYSVLSGVCDSAGAKMEQTFYEDALGQRDLTSLKRTLTLELNSRGVRKSKLSPDGTSSVLLTSPDLVMLKLGSPELEKLIIDHQNGLVATTPSTLHQFFPRPTVTEEPESYSRGFIEAFSDFNNSDSSEAGSYQDSHRGNYSLDHQYSNYNQDDKIIVKDEPQTVPNIGSPPMSPIDMESQEKIKLERKRLRNRVAASKCRKRKLERIALLDDKVKILKGENSELTDHVNRLKEQVYQLKQQVMEHAKSGCYISVISSK